MEGNQRSYNKISYLTDKLKKVWNFLLAKINVSRVFIACIYTRIVLIIDN